MPNQIHCHHLKRKAAALKLEDNPVMSSCCNWELISNVSRDEYASQQLLLFTQQVKAPSVLIPPSSKLIPPSSASVTANAIASHSFPRVPSSVDGLEAQEKLEKFSDLWTSSKVGILWCQLASTWYLIEFSWQSYGCFGYLSMFFHLLSLQYFGYVPETNKVKFFS